MIREKRIIKDLVDQLGDELDYYIMNFDKIDIWVYKENELVVNKTFKKILEIVASYNLTTANVLLKDAYNLASEFEGKEEILFGILLEMTKLYLKSGSNCLLNRVLLFCLNLHVFSYQEKKKPTQLLLEIYNTDIVVFKNSLTTKIKYIFKRSEYPYKVIVDSIGLTLISLLNGKSVNDNINDFVDDITI